MEYVKVKINAGEFSPADELAKEIENIIKKHFPNSLTFAKFSNNLYPSIRLTFALGKDKSQWSNGIIHNDPAHHVFIIEGFDKEGNLGEKIAIEGHIGSGVYTKPNASGKVTIPFRKKTGKPELVKKHIDAYFAKLKEAAKQIDPEYVKKLGISI